MEASTMFETLYRLSLARFPVNLADQRQIENLRKLDAAGYVRAFIPPPHVDCDDCMRQDPATVLGITPQGWSILGRGSNSENSRRRGRGLVDGP
jgi:uncharacterized membrane protein